MHLQGVDFDICKYQIKEEIEKASSNQIQERTNNFEKENYVNLSNIKICKHKYIINIQFFLLIFYCDTIQINKFVKITYLKFISFFFFSYFRSFIFNSYTMN